MFRPLYPILVLLGATLAVGACKNHSGPGSGSSSGGATGGGGTVTLDFAGALDAAPTAGDTVAVRWNAATNSAGAPPAAMRYRVYRAREASMKDEVLAADGISGTSLLDAGLLDDVTYFYRVVAMDPAGNQEDGEAVVSAHLPEIPPTPLNYATQVGPLWSTVTGNDGVTVCTDCHYDGAKAGYGFLSLSSWERLMIGRGTPDKPNSLIIEGNAKATGRDFLEAYLRATETVREHQMWRFRQDLFLPEVQVWVDEGAHEVPDLSRPVFDFDDVQNQARYTVTDNGDGTVTVNFPHALDPESEPYRGTVNDHLEYHVYGGAESTSIDWRNPVAVLPRYHFAKTASSWSLRFPWAFATGVFVVRAHDYTGNVALNERELRLGF